MKKILVVEDSSIIAYAINVILASDEIEVKEAYTGEKAVEILNREHFDIVLLDLMLPGISGKETVKEIRKNPTCRNTKILVLTAKPDVSSDKELLVLIDGFFKKPFDNDRLKDEVYRLLGK